MVPLQTRGIHTLAKRHWAEPSGSNSRKILLAKIHKEGNHFVQFVFERSSLSVTELHCMDKHLEGHADGSVMFRFRATPSIGCFCSWTKRREPFAVGCWPRIFFDVVATSFSVQQHFLSSRYWKIVRHRVSINIHYRRSKRCPMSSPDFNHEMYEGYHTAYRELKVDGLQPIERPAQLFSPSLRRYV